MYKAGTIMKALKAGEQPERGNPFAPPEEEKKEEEKKEDPQDMMGGAGGIPDIPSAPIAPLEMPGGQQPDFMSGMGGAMPPQPMDLPQN